MRKETLTHMKKSLAIGLGILAGVLSIGAIAGITIAVNSQARDYIQNKVDQVLNDDALDLSKTKIESTLEMTKAEKANQGVQADAQTKGVWYLEFAIKDLPSEVNAESVKLQTNIIRGDAKKAYFVANLGEDINVQQYEGITHESGDSFSLQHDLFKKDASETYTVRTYWVAHPSVYVDTKVTFSYEKEEAQSSAAVSSAATAEMANLAI